MTQGERLVRNLCDATREAVRQAQKEPPDVTPLADTPARVRAAVVVLRKYRPVVAKAKATIKAAGYYVPEDDEALNTLAPNYQTRRATETQRNERRDSRYTQINTLQAAAIVDTLSMRGQALEARLRQLQQDLAKV